MLEWLEYEEQFGRFWHRLVGDVASYRSYDDAAVSFAEVRGCLGVFFRGLGGTPGLAIAAGTAQSSKHRLRLRQRIGLVSERLEVAELSPERLLLPSRIACFPAPEQNRKLYLWLTAFLAAAPRFFAPPPDDPLQADLALIRSAQRTSDALCRAYPGLARMYRELCAVVLTVRPRRLLPKAEAAVEAMIEELLSAPASPSPLLELVYDPDMPLDGLRAPRGYRRFLPIPLWGQVVPGEVDAAEPQGDDPDAGGGPRDQDERARRARRRRFDQAERDDSFALINKGEMLLLASEMVNVNRRVEDEEDEAAARQAAQDMEEISIGAHQQRSGSRVRLELDLPPAAAADAPLRAPLLYPEWDYRRRAYRENYCSVVVGPASEEGEDWRPDATARRRIALVRRQFEALRPRREILPRQLDGNELDLDALVRARSDLQADGIVTDRIWRDARQRARDLAASILVDVSLSTDSWVDNRRVLDVAKEALSALAYGLEACGDDFAIHTFTSRKRSAVRVETVKAFDEPLATPVLRRIAALRPGHYTRMGAALRHVQQGLLTRPERHRLLLLLTDGKPHDIDHYEGRYGAEDTRRAITEARASGTAVFAITIDREAGDYLPYVFGRGGYALVSRIDRLSRALPIVYQHLVG